jgi:hypothetical protein
MAVSNPAFSRVLYMVPTVDAQGNTYAPGGNTATVNEGVLDGSVAIADSPFTNAANASGIASTSRYFVPVNAPGIDGDGIDYGTDAQNLAAQRTQSQQMVGTDSGQDDRQIGVTVYAPVG